MGNEEICEEYDTDSAEALVEEYEMKRRNRARIPTVGRSRKGPSRTEKCEV